MRALFDELRHNPDIAAVVVLSLTLGVAPQSGLKASVWTDPPAGMRIHRVLLRPARIFDVLGSRLAMACERMQRRAHF
jgi:hypothetical protein